jgi:hypothetical protein
MSLRLAQDRSYGGRLHDPEILIAVVEDRIRAPDTVLLRSRRMMALSSRPSFRGGLAPSALRSLLTFRLVVDANSGRKSTIKGK